MGFLDTLWNGITSLFGGDEEAQPLPPAEEAPPAEPPAETPPENRGGTGGLAFIKPSRNAAAPAPEEAPAKETPSGLTDTEITNIIFNESRSLSGKGIDEARRNIAHAILNGEAQKGADRPRTASIFATVPKAEQSTYDQIRGIVGTVREEKKQGADPTGGAIHFNFRNGDSTGPWRDRHPIQTQIGPLQNSYPTEELGKENVYANTYLGATPR